MFRSSILLLVVLCLLIGADYLSAWTAPTAMPPGDNVAAPINTDDASQIKQGGLGVGALDVAGGALIRGTTVTTDLDLTVTGRVGAREYCDESGLNCFSAVNFPIGVSCPAGQAINAINADGTIRCIPAGASTPVTTYSWYLGPQNQLSGSCDSPRQCGSYCTATGVVQCRNSEGAVVSDSNCSSPKPTNSRITNAGSICSGNR